MLLSLAISRVLLPVALVSTYCEFKNLQMFKLITKLTPSLIAFICFCDSQILVFTTCLIYSSKFCLVTFTFLPPGINSTCVPLESKVTKYSSIAASKSSSLNPFALFLRSSITYHEQVSNALRSISLSASVSVSISSIKSFQKIGAKSNGSACSLLMAAPMK